MFCNDSILVFGHNLLTCSHFSTYFFSLKKINWGPSLTGAQYRSFNFGKQEFGLFVNEILI